MVEFKKEHIIDKGMRIILLCAFRFRNDVKGGETHVIYYIDRMKKQIVILSAEEKNIPQKYATIKVDKIGRIRLRKELCSEIAIGPYECVISLYDIENNCIIITKKP